MTVKVASVVGVTAIGLATRLYRLDQPPTPVFDEYHVGRFVNWFDEGLDSFDLHPPMLKMVFRQAAVALGYEGRSGCSYGAGDPFLADHTVPFETCSMWQLRTVSAVSGR